jgi:hypothetical protein
MLKWQYEALAELPEGRTAAVNTAIEEKYGEYFEEMIKHAKYPKGEMR